MLIKVQFVLLMFMPHLIDTLTIDSNKYLTTIRHREGTLVTVHEHICGDVLSFSKVSVVSIVMQMMLLYRLAESGPPPCQIIISFFYFLFFSTLSLCSLQGVGVSVTMLSSLFFSSLLLFILFVYSFKVVTCSLFICIFLPQYKTWTGIFIGE